MIKCVAIDDEPIALSIIEEYCNRLGNIELECFTSPIAGMECVARTHPDIVFLDIEMNSHNGIELARQLPDNSCLIFTTAYAQYALDGFDADAIDFLHKPIFFPRFERAVAKASTWLAKNTDSRRKTITLKSEHKNVIINLDDIEFIEAMDNYVKIFRKGMPTVISQITMKEMGGMLPDKHFARVHRSYIVSLAAIDRFSNRQIYFAGHRQPVPVGRKYHESFNNIYNLSLINI
ncbi:MAG: LytTR family DNA-binding domain-containing protein [Muribaculaceae bacterium]|nr:LytTR family DNA-binding domain-containing protein [Muribaculaceae bacterium]